MWRFLIIILISSLVILGVWSALRAGLTFYPTKAASPSALDAAPSELQSAPELQSPIEPLSPHSARASLGHMAALSVTLQLPTASGAVVPVTVPVEMELSLEVAVTGGRAGILSFRQQTIPVIAVQPLLAQHLLTTASDEATLRPAQTLVLVPTPTPTRPQVPAPLAPAVAYNVNMRRGPDTAFPIVGKIRPGDTFAVVARNADASWYRVMHGDGATGWIAAYLVQGAPAPETLAVAVLNTPALLETAVTPSP